MCDRFIRPCSSIFGGVEEQINLHVDYDTVVAGLILSVNFMITCTVVGRIPRLY